MNYIAEMTDCFRTRKSHDTRREDIVLYKRDKSYRMLNYYCSVATVGIENGRFVSAFFE